MPTGKWLIPRINLYNSYTSKYLKMFLYSRYVGNTNKSNNEIYQFMCRLKFRNTTTEYTAESLYGFQNGFNLYQILWDLGELIY